MSNPNLERDIMMEAYLDLKVMIVGLAKSHWLKFGGDIEEIIADANLIFIEAFGKHDENRAALTTWTFFIIRQKLIVIQQKMNKRKQIETAYCKTKQIEYEEVFS